MRNEAPWGRHREAPGQLSSVPSNRQLVQGLMGTIIVLSSTLYEAIAGEEGTGSGPAVLLQTLAPIQEKLEQLVQRLEMQEQSSSHARPRPQSVPHTHQSRRPQTSRNQATFDYDGAVIAPQGSSSGREKETDVSGRPAKVGVASETVTDLVTEPSFVVPPAWREITNLDSYMAESSDEEPTQRVAPSTSGATFFDPTLAQSSPLSRNETAEDGSRKAGQTFVLPAPKRTLEELFKPPSAVGTFAVRETSNYALPDGSFQRSTKTIAGPDASVLTKCSRPMVDVVVFPTVSGGPEVSRSGAVPSAPPEAKLDELVVPRPINA